MDMEPPRLILSNNHSLSFYNDMKCDKKTITLNKAHKISQVRQPSHTDGYFALVPKYHSDNCRVPCKNILLHNIIVYSDLCFDPITSTTHYSINLCFEFDDNEMNQRGENLSSLYNCTKTYRLEHPMQTNQMFLSNCLYETHLISKKPEALPCEDKP